MADGEKLQDAPGGSPEQESDTGNAKPFCGVTKTVVVPLCPVVRVREGVDRVMEKLGVGASTV
jgi:hypothetical protein